MIFKTILLFLTIHKVQAGCVFGEPTSKQYRNSVSTSYAPQQAFQECCELGEACLGVTQDLTSPTGKLSVVTSASEFVSESEFRSWPHECDGSESYDSCDCSTTSGTSQTCPEFDECTDNDLNDCDDICINTIGSYACECGGNTVVHPYLCGECVDADLLTCASYQGDCQDPSSVYSYRVIDSTYCSSSPCTQSDCCLIFYDEELMADMTDCSSDRHVCDDIGLELRPECEDRNSCVCPEQNCDAWQCCEDFSVPQCEVAAYNSGGALDLELVITAQFSLLMFLYLF